MQTTISGVRQHPPRWGGLSHKQSRTGGRCESSQTTRTTQQILWMTLDERCARNRTINRQWCYRAKSARSGEI